MTWILLYIMIGIMVLINLLLLAIYNISVPDHARQMARLLNIINLSSSIPFSLSILSSFGAVMAVILMASTVGNEYNWRTLRIALISSEDRIKLLGAKVISVVILVVIGMVVSVVVGFIMSIITNSIAGNALNFGFITGSYCWDQFVQFWRTLYIIMPFALMGLLFSVVGRSAMPGIAVGAGILFLEPIITALMSAAGGWVSSIPKYLFAANVDVINDLNNLPGGFGAFGGTAAQPPSVLHAVIILGAYIVVFIVVAFCLFKKRDVTG